MPSSTSTSASTSVPPSAYVSHVQAASETLDDSVTDVFRGQRYALLLEAHVHALLALAEATRLAAERPASPTFVLPAYPAPAPQPIHPYPGPTPPYITYAPSSEASPNQCDGTPPIVRNYFTPAPAARATADRDPSLQWDSTLLPSLTNPMRGVRVRRVTPAESSAHAEELGTVTSHSPAGDRFNVRWDSGTTSFLLRASDVEFVRA